MSLQFGNAGPTKGAVRLLLVDDQPEIMRLLLLHFADNPGYEVCASVATGAEALQVARRFAPGAIIGDYNLGAPAEGAVLVSALRSVYPRSQLTVMSADTAARAQALAASADAFLDNGAAFSAGSAPPADALS